MTNGDTRLRTMLRHALMLSAVMAAPAAAQRGSTELKVGAVAPVVTVADLDGRPVRIAVVPGKKGAVVEFWATWCELCAELLPKMQAAKARYGDRFDFYGVNVTVNDGKARVTRYVAEHKPPFLTLYDDGGVAVRAFNALSTAKVVVVDAKGIVRYMGDGGDQDIVAILGRVVGP